MTTATVATAANRVVRTRIRKGLFRGMGPVRGVAEMEAVIDGLVQYGTTNSMTVQSAPVAERRVELIAGRSGK